MTDVHLLHAQRHHDHTHDHGHPHDHTYDHHHHHHHEHDHHRSNIWRAIAQALHLPGFTHAHDPSTLTRELVASDNDLAIRTVWLALLALGLTTVIQIIIVLASGSVALLADTVHNFGDALNSLPLLLAFYLARRRPNKRYTYGYQRAEDVAGILIVVSIAFSAAYILWESINKLFNPQPLENLAWVAAAAFVGFAGNELVALLQIRVGRKIGSEAMVADGLHARIDGLTSLAVLIAAGGAVIGLPILDPIIGILIGIAIVFITRNAALAIWYRLMDAVDPDLISAAEAAIQQHPEVKAIRRLQMRWLGHRLYAEIVLELDPALNLTQVEQLTDHISHHLYHELPTLSEVTIAPVPWHEQERRFWQETEHHRLITV